MPVLPSRQLRQRPQAILKGTETRSPTFKNSTSLPFSMISPVISCPRTIPAGAVVRPRTMCWSLPQMLVLTTLRITPCSHFREPSDNFGNSIGRTSTFPGPTYTTPRLLAIKVRSFKNLECFGSSFPYGGSRGHYYPDRVVPFQLFAPLFLVRLYGGHRPHTFEFAPVVAATCQREVDDRQQHH